MRPLLPPHRPTTAPTTHPARSCSAPHQILRGASANSAARFTQGIKIRYETFLKYWEDEIAPYDRLERFFRTIKQASAECIFKVSSSGGAAGRGLVTTSPLPL